MLALLKSRLQDMRTLATLCTAAEATARRLGGDRPGSEHYVLAAIDLPDGTARAAFDLLGIDPARFEAALDGLHREALASVGIVDAPTASAAVPRRAPPAAFESAPSGEALVQRLAGSRGERRPRALLGADVLEAVAAERHSLAARAFRALHVGPEGLLDASRRARGEPARAIR